jgi:hypothetical protein
MRRTAFAVALVVLACAWLAADSVPGDQRNPRMLNASGNMYIGLVDPGHVTCIGGEATGSFPPCSPGTQRVVWRDFIGTLMLQDLTGEAAPYLVSTMFTPSNCNLDANYRGPCWGTFHGSDAAIGTWEGSWTGMLDFATFGASLSMVGTGSGGMVEGLHLRIEAFVEGTGDPYAPTPFTARVFQVRE